MSRNIFRCSLVPLSLLIGLCSGFTASGEDTICGPRCVKYIIDYFDRPAVFLSDLVVDMQGKNYRQNLSSFEALETALVTHGVYARLVKLESPEFVVTKRWSGPIVLHQGGSHFVLLLPPKSGETTKPCMWDGLRGSREISRSEIGKQFSGYVLLTSSEPITDEILEEFNRGVYQRNGQRRARQLTYAVLIAIGATGIFATRRLQKAGLKPQVSK